MLCEICQQRPATAFVNLIVERRGTTEQVTDRQEKTTHYCASCAAPFLQQLRFLREPRSLPPESSLLLLDVVFQHAASIDRRFAAEAFRFVHRSVIEAARLAGGGSGHHVSGRDVAEALRSGALREFGASALTTLHGWGLHSTDDIGTVVFRLVELGVLGANPGESVQDFHRIYEFESAFPAVV